MDVQSSSTLNFLPSARLVVGSQANLTVAAGSFCTVTDWVMVESQATMVFARDQALPGGLIPSVVC